VSRFRFVEAEAAQFPVSLLCRVVGVTRQGYYAWKRRPPSARELADHKLGERIRQIHTETQQEIYGAPRIHSELCLGDGVRVGKKRVARLMRQLGLRGADGRRGGPRTTIRDPQRRSAPDLVDRDFVRGAPDRLWVCDLKYVQTGQGFLFLAAVQDVFSRRIIGWSMRADLKAELVLDALGMAVSARGGAAGVIAHSDHGSQYTSLAYGAYAKQSGIDLSMGSIGDPWDNALAESFFASLEKELLRREHFATREQARLRIFWYIECFYNPRRRHSSLGYLSPTDYEQRHQQEAIAA
jgi:putative transposase